MVVLDVKFFVEGASWRHSFDVDSGSTVLDLKRKMLKGEGSQRDLDSFELRRLGRRVPDSDIILEEIEFDWEWLGPDVGAQRKRQENAEVGCLEVQASAKESHSLPTSAETSLSATGYEVTISLDRNLGLTSTVRVPEGATILDVKKVLAGQDSTRMLRDTEIELGVWVGDSAVPLPDDTVLTQNHVSMHLLEGKSGSNEEHAASPEQFHVPVAAPRPPDCERGSTFALPRWEVVGGTDKGGILVREGKSTSTTQKKDRLATGSVVHQLSVEGERLKYKRLTGTGPDTGWVSLTVSGKALLVPHKGHTFTLDNALSLQEDLIRGFAKAEFQRALAEVIREFPEKTGTKFGRKRNELLLTVQSQVLPEYGFEGTSAGVMKVISAFAPYSERPDVAWNQEQINLLLRV